jgi:uncharacterized protein (UPF0297 family)
MDNKDEITVASDTVDNSKDLGDTQFFTIETDNELTVKKTLRAVYKALTEKGYNPVVQLVGYVMSGDPTYITNHKNARSLIAKVERDELVEELLREYIKSL